MYCPKCGQQLPKYALFCKRCGTNVQKDFAGANPEDDSKESLQNNLNQALSKNIDYKQKTEIIQGEVINLKDYVIEYINNTLTDKTLVSEKKWCRWTVIVGIPLVIIFFFWKFFSGFSFSGLCLFILAICLLVRCWQTSIGKRDGKNDKPIAIKALCVISLLAIIVWGIHGHSNVTYAVSGGSKTELYKKYVGKWQASTYAWDEDLRQEMHNGNIEIKINDDGTGHILMDQREGSRFVVVLDQKIHHVHATNTRLDLDNYHFIIDHGVIRTGQGKRFSKKMFSL